MTRTGRRFVAAWPAYAITAAVGAFVAVVGALWVAAHVVARQPVDATAWIILLATLLRAVTVVIALSSVRRWGRALPPVVVLTGLWACAAAQLAYPVAELAVKLALVAGVVDLPATGIGDLGATGWFNLSAAWVIFGLPGALFVAAAVSYRNRRSVSGPWPVVGMLTGTALLFALGWLIG
ncbi:hypothetical protein [Pseudonocardia humida]|uniref:Leader peptidase (Prepilin peptidase)/N-methyltransferase n=1 Tax=Pseudonocardia humida TaxID=2800819 RepID=A0ABT1A891_9PSEU|nr:hypothetical protein [Pseudonocardia humida]MCO1659039.1 hypothetical protein [Pseudonocardia humida]